MTILDAIQRDRLAMSVAGALALANEAAIANGMPPDDCIVNISEEVSPTGRRWKVQYGPRNYIGRRGGDLIVLVDGEAERIERVIRGQ